MNENAQKRPDGTIVNALELEDMPKNSTTEQLGAKLNQIAKMARTNGNYKEIGRLYNFKLLVKTVETQKDGIDILQNRFFARGKGWIYYTHNNGIIAKDPNLATMNFLNALKKIPGLIKDQKEVLAKYEKDVAILKNVAFNIWNKEGELKELKKDLETIDRKFN